MTAFNPATFRTANKPHYIECMFSGPITNGTILPVAKKHKRLFGKDVYLIGWTNKVGCFSVAKLPGNRVDVAFYIYNTPNALNEEDLANAVYEEYQLHPGWGFAAIAKLNELLDEKEVE